MSANLEGALVLHTDCMCLRDIQKRLNRLITDGTNKETSVLYTGFVICGTCMNSLEIVSSSVTRSNRQYSAPNR